MENQIFRDINTGLDLNGPYLSFTQQPQDVIGIGTTSIRSPNTWISSANWQQRTVPAGESGWAVNNDALMYGNDLFVTAGSAGYIATSPDSITWTLTPQINGDSNLNWHSGAFGNGRFVIVGQRINDNTLPDPIAAVSSDGINWTLVTVTAAAPMQILTALASDGSKFVASGNDPTHPVSSNLVTSTDGLNWSAIPDTVAGDNDLYWGNGVWISMRQYGNYSRSTDGTTWVDYTVPGGMSGSSPVAYGNGLWVMMIGTNTIAHSTDNALTWTVSSHTVDGVSTYGIRDIAYGPAGWIAGSAGELGSTGFLIVSEDGYNWTYPNSDYKDLFDLSVYGVLYANGYYVAQADKQIASATIPMDTEVPVPSASFVGIATATFTPTGIASNQGTIAYQWYKQGVGALSDDGTKIVGAATTTLVINNLLTPDDNGEYYVQADYVPTYSGVGDPRIGSGYRTGNAPNEPIQSENATLYVNPLIEIITEPSSFQTNINENARFDVNARLVGSPIDDLQYQWVVDGVEVNDGTSIGFGAGSTQNIEQTFTDDGTITIPAGSTDVRITIAGASGGHGGSGDSTNANGGLGGNGRIGVFTLLSSAIDRTLDFDIGTIGNGGTSQNSATQIGGVFQNGGWGGNSVVGAGGGGGNSSFNANLLAGGGGGGGGATGFRDPALGTDYIAIAGGGGGGGGDGGSIGNAPDAQGTINGDGTPFRNGSRQLLLAGRNGTGGSQGLPGGGGGGGGADLNVILPETGQAHNGGAGGSGDTGAFGFSGTSAFDNRQVGLNDEDTNSGNGYANVSYVGEGEPTTRNMVISGSKTPNLIISSSNVGVSTVRCKISSATAFNSPQYTNLVNYAVVSVATSSVRINIEEITGQEPRANLVSIDLANGEYNFWASSNETVSTSPHTYIFYSPDRDVEVEMDLYGGMGTPVERRSVTGGETFTTPGAEGGYSRIRVKMKRNREYTIAGLIPDVNTPFLYEVSRLIAVVGEGGHLGGGRGGGCGIAGEGLTGGAAGGSTSTQLPTAGIFGSNFISPILQSNERTAASTFVAGNDTQATGRDGGRTLGCPRGIWWAQQGVEPCIPNWGFGWYDNPQVDANLPDFTPNPDPIGNPGDAHSGWFRLPNGQEVKNTANNLLRGFKSGYNIMQTAGAGEPMRVDWWGSHAMAGGRGGNGAWGGQGGEVNQGGGGGSGFARESDVDPYNPPVWGGMKVIDTQLGGSTWPQARVVLRLANIEEAVPQEVVFTQSNALNAGTTWTSNENMQVVFTLEEGIGPQTLTFGLPPGSTDQLPSQVTYLIQIGAVYSVTSSSNVTTASDSAGALFLNDVTDIPTGSLSITPSLGEFVPNAPGTSSIHNVNYTYQFVSNLL